MSSHEKREVLFVDDDEFILDALRVRLRSERKRWNMRFACGGELAIDMVNQVIPDVVITDLNMPVMNGAELLALVRDIAPTAARIVMSGEAHSEIAAAARPLHHRWASKPTDAKELIALVNRTLRVRDAIRFKPVQDAVNALETRLESPRRSPEILSADLHRQATAESVEAALGADPALTAKVLTYAGFGAAAPDDAPQSIGGAIAQLGIESVAHLSLAAEWFRHLAPDAAATDLTGLERKALIASKIASDLMLGDPNAKTAQFAGLLHEVGIVALVDADHWQGASASLISGAVSIQDQVEAIGTGHPSLGAALLDRWNVADTVIEAVAFHCDEHDDAPAQLDCTQAVRIAAALAAESVHGSTADDLALLPSGLDASAQERCKARIADARRLALDLT